MGPSNAHHLSHKIFSVWENFSGKTLLFFKTSTIRSPPSLLSWPYTLRGIPDWNSFSSLQFCEIGSLLPYSIPTTTYASSKILCNYIARFWANTSFVDDCKSTLPKLKLSYSLPLSLEGIYIQWARQLTYLGVITDCRLIFSEHINRTYSSPLFCTLKTYPLQRVQNLSLRIISKQPLSVKLTVLH